MAVTYDVRCTMVAGHAQTTAPRRLGSISMLLALVVHGALIQPPPAHPVWRAEAQPDDGVDSTPKQREGGGDGPGGGAHDALADDVRDWTEGVSRRVQQPELSRRETTGKSSHQIAPQASPPQSQPSSHAVSRRLAGLSPLRDASANGPANGPANCLAKRQSARSTSGRLVRLAGCTHGCGAASLSR